MTSPIPPAAFTEPLTLKRVRLSVSLTPTLTLTLSHQSFYMTFTHL